MMFWVWCRLLLLRGSRLSRLWARSGVTKPYPRVDLDFDTKLQPLPLVFLKSSTVWLTLATDHLYNAMYLFDSSSHPLSDHSVAVRKPVAFVASHGTAGRYRISQTMS